MISDIGGGLSLICDIWGGMISDIGGGGVEYLKCDILEV